MVQGTESLVWNGEIFWGRGKSSVYKISRSASTIKKVCCLSNVCVTEYDLLSLKKLSPSLNIEIKFRPWATHQVDI